MLQESVKNRANNACELCKSEAGLDVFFVPESPDETAQSAVLACDTCIGQITGSDELNATHLRCLNDAVWSPTPAVQVLSYRLLHKLSAEGWAQDLLDMMYLDEDIKQWAEAGLIEQDATLDCNGTPLHAGDNVHLTLSLIHI